MPVSFLQLVDLTGLQDELVVQLSYGLNLRCVGNLGLDVFNA